jgi:glycosyltransferase involved in cell wall biosynthesis
MKPKIKLSYFLSHPIQYFSPLLKEMDEVFDLQVYYYSDISIKGGMDKGFGKRVQWDIPLLEGYRSTFIRNYSKSRSVSNRFFDAINPGVIRHLWKDQSKIVIVNGWDYFSTILVIIFAGLMGKKVWLRAENPLSQELQKSRKVLFIKSIILKYLLFRLVDKFLYIGKDSRKFFQYYGARDSQLVYTPYAVDNDFFDEHYRTLSADRQDLKSKLGLPTDKKIILFTGKYIAKKRPLDLLKAFKSLNSQDSILVMVGEGELRDEMTDYIREQGIENVHLTGFINQSAIPSYYMVADVFVMCSGKGETWGLAVNEAMNFAKPVIVSSTCGCSSDLVEHGKNGWIVEEGNIPALAAALKKTVENPAFSIRAGRLSKEIVTSFSNTHIVNNLLRATRFRSRGLRPVRVIYRKIFGYKATG